MSDAGHRVHSGAARGTREASASLVLYVGSTTQIDAFDRRRVPIANVTRFFHRSTKRGEQSQAEYQKMYDDGIQIALKYFGE
jgi:hypothetical protein